MDDPYEQMDQLLLAWKLPQLRQVFRGQEINIEVLDALTDADIVELIPKVGPRAVFRKRLNEWLNTTEVVYEEQAAEEGTQLENNNQQYYEIEKMENIDNQCHVEEMNLPSEEIAVSNEVDITVEKGVWTEHQIENNATSSKDHNAGKEEATSNETSEFIHIDFLDEEEQPQEAILKTEPHSFDKDNSQNFKTEIKVEVLNAEIDIRHLLNVEQILLKNDIGRLIIDSYAADPQLDKRTRHYIADLIITEVFAKNLVLDRVKFQGLAHQICELFPHEDIRTWFIAQNSSRNSGGTLFNKYYTVYRKMRKTGFYEHYIDGVIKSSDGDLEEHSVGKMHSINPAQIEDEPEKLALKRAIPKYERLRRSCDFEQIHVKNLLESSFEGRGIIEIYEKQQAFDVATRNRLCKLIVMEATRLRMTLRPRNFYDISCQIVELFPNETIDMYFLPRGRTPPKGCLYHKYLYIKRRLRQISVRNKAYENVE